MKQTNIKKYEKSERENHDIDDEVILFVYQKI